MAQRTRGRDHDHLAGSVGKPRKLAGSANRVRWLKSLSIRELAAHGARLTAESAEVVAEAASRLDGVAARGAA